MNTPTPLQSIPPQYPPAAYPPGSYPPGYYQVNRTAGPVKVLGIIYAVFAVLSVFGFFVVLALALIPGFAAHDQATSDVIASAAPKILFGFIAIIIGLNIVLHGLTAYGLLAVKSWGRTLAIVAGIISLISIPIGTILGGCTLYFLMRQGAQQEYDQLALGRNHHPGMAPTGGPAF